MRIAWPQPADSIALPADQLDVWAVRLGGKDALFHEAASMLTAEERQRAEQFRVDEPRRRFVITRAALRGLLGKYLGRPANSITIEYDPNGKPRLAGGRDENDVHFNVAHSGSLALIAVTAGCEVGIDVERVRAVSHAEHIARRYFHPAEAEVILAAARSARDALFLRCWTGKEAVLKSLGSGITGSLAAICVPTDDFRAVWIDLPSQHSNLHSRCWLQQLAPGPGYVGAVACLGEERLVRCFAFEW
jgi:4'-phosphopantetheinyl transferase